MRGEAGGTSLLCDVCRQQQQQQQEQTPGAAVPFCSVHCTHRECNEVVALPSAGSNATICHNLDLAGAGDGKAVVLYRRDSHLQRRRGRAGGRAGGCEDWWSPASKQPRSLQAAASLTSAPARRRTSMVMTYRHVLPFGGQSSVSRLGRASAATADGQKTVLLLTASISSMPVPMGTRTRFCAAAAIVHRLRILRVAK